MQRAPETAAEMLQRAEVRDDWLGVLLPVAVASLLVLVLIIRRQRRAGSTGLDGLFRPRRLPDAAAWWREWRARSLEREQSLAAMRAAEAEQAQQAAGERQSGRTHEILGVDGSVLLQAEQRVLVETLTTDHDGSIAYMTDEGIALFLHPKLVAWDRIRRISVREGPERKWWIPTTLGVLGAAVLGSCGALFDAIQHGFSGRDQHGELMIWGILIGAAAAGAVGMAIMYSFRPPRWRTLVEAPRGTAPLTLQTLAARARPRASAAAPDQPGREAPA